MRIRGLCMLVVAAGALLSCTSDGEPDADSADDEGFVPCEYISAGEVAEVTGLEMIEDEDVSADPLCAFKVDDGPVGLSVQVDEVPTAAEFDSLRPTDQAVVDVVVESADEAFVWTTAANIQEAVVRSEGSAARLSLVWEAPPGDTAAIEALMATVAASLPEAEYGEADAPGEATCAVVSVEELSEALSLPGLVAAPAGASTTCAISDTETGVNLLIDLPEGAAGQEQLNLDGRTSEVDGETYEWVVEAVSGVGDGALWTLDPVSERSGELVALFGDQLVRVTSSSNEPGGELKIRAVTAAQIAAGDGAG